MALDHSGHKALLGLLSRPFSSPQNTFSLVLATAIAILAFGLYLQHVVGLEPCPMCIVQRYALIGVGIFASLAAFVRFDLVRTAAGLLAFISAGFGAFVAARQSWLQWYPPEIATCGRDFYGMIETFPLKRAVPMIFKGSGDCTKIDWTFLGLSVANWSFLSFVVLMAVVIAGIFRAKKQLVAI